MFGEVVQLRNVEILGEVGLRVKFRGVVGVIVLKKESVGLFDVLSVELD